MLPAIQGLLASLLLIGASYAQTYTVINKCPGPIDLFIGQESQGTLASGASLVKTGLGTSAGYFYTTTRAIPGFNGALTAVRAGFFFEPNYWYYYIVKDENPHLFNTPITITPDQPPSSDGYFCNPITCLDGYCNTAFSHPPVFNGGPPPPDSIPSPPNFQCKVPGTNFNITFCPQGDWAWPQGAPIRSTLPSTFDKCVDVKGAVRANGTPVQLYDCNLSIAQLWYIQPGLTKVQLHNTNFCLDAGTNPRSGTPLKIWQCYDNLPAQQWRWLSNGRLLLEGTGLCLDATDGDVSNFGPPLQVWQCTDQNPNQSWYVSA